MNLAERYTEDEKIAAINKWMETVNEITSETVSLADPNDPLTELDRENYCIVRYKDGTEKRDLSSRDVPSSYVQTHRFDYAKLGSKNSIS